MDIAELEPMLAVEFPDVQPLIYHTHLLHFAPNRYLLEPEQLWLIESVVGAKSLDKMLNDRLLN
jgi:hypothetical protein